MANVVYGTSGNSVLFTVEVHDRNGRALTVTQNDVIDNDGTPVLSNPAWFSYTTEETELPDGTNRLNVNYDLDTSTITTGIYTVDLRVSNGVSTITRTFIFQWDGTLTSFLPNDLSSLALWLSADRLIRMEDGDAVTVWDYQTNKTNWNAPFQVIQDDKPKYIASAYNSKPALYFDTHSDRMFAFVPAPVVENTIIMVIRPVSPDTSASPESTLSGSFPYKYLFYQNALSFGISFSYKEIRYDPSRFIANYFGPGQDWDGPAIVSRQGGNSANEISAPIINNAEPAIISRNFALNGQTGQIYVNGALEGQGTDTGSSLTNTDIFIGYGTGCEIYEYLIFDIKLSDSDRKQVEDYLAVKYNIPAYIPNIDITTLGDTVSHYIAESISGGDLSGTDVITWADQVGSNDLTAPTAGQRPERLASDVNSLASVEFDGVDELLTGSLSTNSKFTVGMVFQIVGTSDGTFFEGSDSGGTNFGSLAYDSNDDIVFTHGTTSASSNQPSLPDSWHILIATFNDGFGTTFFDDIVRLDQSEIISANFGLNDINTVALGAREADSDHVNVKIAELIVYNDQPSLQDIRLIEKHWQNKYAI